MAVLSWIKGQKYSINVASLQNITAEVIIPFSYLYVEYDDVKLEVNGYGEVSKQNNNSSYEIYRNDSAGNQLISNFNVDEFPTKIEFVYDYDANNYGENTPTDNLKAICDEVGEKPLVAIYDQYRSVWVNLPMSSDYRGMSITVVDSARNSEGQVIAQVKRSDIAKIEMRWNFLTTQQYADIAKLFEINLNGNFIVPVSFFNITTGNFEGSIKSAPNTTTNKVRLFYPNDRVVDFAHIKLDNNGKPIGYTDVSLHLIDTGLKYGDTL